MPRVSLAHEQKRRQQILHATMACFARQGYHATSMEDIVRESGLSVGAIYSYFPSKEDLFLALADERIAETVRYLEDLFAAPGPIVDKLHEAVDYFFRLLESDLVPYARLSFEFWSEAPKSERLRERQAQRACRIREFFVRVLTSAREERVLRSDLDIPTVVALLMALNDGLFMHHVTGVQTVPLTSLKAAYVDFVNHALSAPDRAFFPPAADADGADRRRTRQLPPLPYPTTPTAV